MNLSNLKKASDEVLQEISIFVEKNGENTTLKSIIEQMKFISDTADKGLNPKNELPKGYQFNFGILSSREFSSPDELKIKEKIDLVTEQLSKL